MGRARGPRHSRRSAVAGRSRRSRAGGGLPPAAALGAAGISGITRQPLRLSEVVMASADTTPVLKLTGIGKEFGAIRALHDVDMQVRPGEVVGLMGDNGAGKSTLVKIIAGNFRP